MAENIIISCASPYYINICYYLKDTNNKNIRVIFHSNNTGDMVFFRKEVNGDTTKVYQTMPSVYCAGIIDQIYNKVSFTGDLITSVNTIAEIISKCV